MSEKSRKIGKIIGFTIAEGIAIVASIGSIGYLIDKHIRTSPAPSDAIVVEVDKNYVLDDNNNEELPDIDILVLLKDVTPISVTTTGHTTTYSYHSSDLEKIHYRCDQKHLAFTYEEFEERTQDIFRNINFTTTTSNEYNQIDVYQNDNYSSVHTYFTTMHAVSCSELTCDVNYDSSTHEIHDFTLYTGHYSETFKECADQVMQELFDGYTLQTDWETIRKQYNNSTTAYRENFGDIQARIYVIDDYISINVSPNIY